MRDISAQAELGTQKTKQTELFLSYIGPYGVANKLESVPRVCAPVR